MTSLGPPILCPTQKTSPIASIQTPLNISTLLENGYSRKSSHKISYFFKKPINYFILYKFPWVFIFHRNPKSVSGIINGSI